MKLTQKSTKTEVETTETVCEITKSEFELLCAKVASKFVIRVIGDNPDIDDFVAGISMTHFLADFASDLTIKLFNDTDTTENPDKKEEK